MSNYVHKEVVFSQLSAAALTADLTLMSPVGTDKIIRRPVLNVVQAFAGGTVATATLSIGTSAGGTQILPATNVFTGAGLAMANAVLGTLEKIVPAGTTVSCRLTTTVGNTNACTAGKVQIHWDECPLTKEQT